MERIIAALEGKVAELTTEMNHLKYVELPRLQGDIYVLEDEVKRLEDTIRRLEREVGGRR